MDTKSNTEPLAPVTFDEFAPTSYETWKAAAIESLKGGIFEKKLFTKTPEGIVLSPIYTEAEAAPYKERLGFPGAADFLRGTKTAGYAEEPWKIAQEVEAADPAEANKILLEELNKGTNAVNFDAEAVELNTLQDVETLLDQVQLKYAPCPSTQAPPRCLCSPPSCAARRRWATTRPSPAAWAPIPSARP